MADAKFTINGDASDQGFDASEGQALTLQLKTLPTTARTVLFQVFDPAGFDANLGIAANPPRSSPGAPTLTLVGATSGQAVSPATPGGTVAVTMPNDSPHAFIVRCVVDGGQKTLPDGRTVPDPEKIHERMIVIRDSSGSRRVVATETTQYSDDGWAEAVGVGGSATGRIVCFDDRNSPQGLWDFSRAFADMLDDLSGNGIDLQVTDDKIQADFHPGVGGLYIDSGTRTESQAAAPSAVQITGDLTLALILRQTDVSASLPIVSCGAATESEADNFTYQFRTRNSTVPRGASILWETGAGSNIEYNLGNSGDHRWRPPMGSVELWHVVRSSNVVQFYQNARVLGPASGTLTAPTGGTNGRLLIGADSPSGVAPVPFMLGCLAIYDFAYTAQQVLDDWNYTMAPAFGSL